MAWYLIFFLFIAVPVIAQKSPAAMRAGLKTAERTGDPDSLTFYLGHLGYYHHNGRRYDSARYYYKRATAFGHLIGSKLLRADNLVGVGASLAALDDLDSALYYLEKGHKEYLVLQDTVRIGIVAINLASVYRDKGRYDKALGYLLDASYKLEKRPVSALLSDCYGLIGSVYGSTGDPKSSLKYHNKALAVRKALDLRTRFAESYNNIGNAFLALNQYDSALFNYERTLALEREFGDRSGEGICLNNIGELLVKTGEIDRAQQLFREALAIRTETDEEVGQTTVRNNLAHTHLLQGNLSEAEKELKISESMGLSLGLLDHLKTNYELQVRLFREKGNLSKALEYSNQLLVVKDSLLTQEKAEVLAEMHTRYESMKKEDRIALLEKEGLLTAVELDKRQIWIRSLGLAMGLLMVIGALIYLNLRNTRKNKRHIELLLKELHHRVKNNLQILSSLLSLQSQQLTDDSAIKAVRSSESRINAMALIHRKLYTVDQNRTVDIKEYITELIQYLVYSYGYHEKNFKLDLQIEEINIDVDKAIPLGLILNELISNAFKHAYENHPSPRLMVNLAHPDNRELSIRIVDNGRGMPELDEKQRRTFGMKIVSTLIKELKGSVEVKNENGTTYDLHIPI